MSRHEHITRVDLPTLDDVAVWIAFRASPGLPAQTAGPPDSWAPEEPGEIEIEKAIAALGPSPGLHLNPVDVRHYIAAGALDDELGEIADEREGWV